MNDNLLLRFERFVVFYNPASTNSKRSRSRIAELKELVPSKDVIVVETSPKGAEANKKLVVREAKRFDDHTIVCIASGDGTVSAVLEALLTSKDISHRARQVPVLPLWGGNANDLAHMINGLSKKIKLRTIFKKGKVVPIYPLNLELTLEGKSKTRIAACYASFGASAYAAQQLELPRNKKMKVHVIPGARLISEFLIIIKSFAKATTFNMKVSEDKKTVYEHIFVNGSRMAKIDKLPLRLNEKAFYEATFTRKHPAIIISIPRTLHNRKYGKIVEEKREFILHDDTWAQIDGEVAKLPKYTKVAVSLNKTPFFVISTKLHS